MADKKERCRKPVEEELVWDNSSGVAAASETAKPLMSSEGFVTSAERTERKNDDETTRVRPKQKNLPR